MEAKRKRGRPPQGKEKLTITVDGTIYRAMQRLAEGTRSSIANTWLKEGLEKMPVLLFEDNAGGLYLWKEASDTVYETDPYLVKDSDPKEEFAAVYTQRDVGDWSEEWVHAFDKMGWLFENDTEVEHVATWYPDGSVLIHCLPGIAGQRYLRQYVAEEDWDEIWPYPFQAGKPLGQ